MTAVFVAIEAVIIIIDPLFQILISFKYKHEFFLIQF